MTTSLRIKFLVFNLLLVYCGIIKAQEDYYNFENRYSFEDFLFCQGDFLRAYDEYSECLKLKLNDTLIFKSALSLAEINNSVESLKLFDKVKKNSSLYEYSTYAKLHLFFRNSDLISVDSLVSIENISGKENLFYLRISASILTCRKLQEWDEKFFSSTQSEKIKPFYNQRINLKEKDPLVAALFSAIIPGAGKIYTGDYGDGITAFIFTSVLSFLSYDNFRSEHNFKGWLFGGLAAYFYAGNIYGSAVSANIYNLKIRLDFDTKFSVFLEQENYFLPDFKKNLFNCAK